MVTVGMATASRFMSGVLVDTIENENLDGVSNNTSTGGESNTHEYCVGEMVSQVDLVFVDGSYNNEVGLTCTLLTVN